METVPVLPIFLISCIVVALIVAGGIVAGRSLQRSAVIAYFALMLGLVSVSAVSVIIFVLLNGGIS